MELEELGGPELEVELDDVTERLVELDDDEAGTLLEADVDVLDAVDRVVYGGSVTTWLLS